MGKECGVLTVDSDGNGLRENEAVGALEGGDLAELVELQVLLRDALGGLGGDELDIEAVLLGDGEERGGARVTLRGLSVPVVGCAAYVEPGRAQLRRRWRRATHAVAVDLSERHDCWRTVDGTVQSRRGGLRRWRKEKRCCVEVGVSLVFALLFAR